MEALLKVDGLTKHFKDFALNDVSFMLPYGSIMGFVGENGAGKTTTIKLILGLLHKEEGVVELFGQACTDEQSRHKEKIGVVFDASNFHDVLRPRDVGRILKGMYRDWDENEFNRLVAQFKLPMNSKNIKEFSSGMKKKLSIAAALAHHPQLLILDEPTSGLDPVVRSEILDILLDFIQDERRGVLLSSHITSDLERIADYITFIHEGRVVFSRTKDELLESYGIARCTKEQADMIDPALVKGSRRSTFGVELLVENRHDFGSKHPGIAIDAAGIEDIMTFIARGTAA